MSEPDEEGRRAYEEVAESRRAARRVKIADVDLGLTMIFALLAIGVILGFGAAIGWHLAARLLRLI